MKVRSGIGRSGRNNLLEDLKPRAIIALFKIGNAKVIVSDQLLRRIADDIMPEAEVVLPDIALPEGQNPVKPEESDEQDLSEPDRVRPPGQPFLRANAKKKTKAQTRQVHEPVGNDADAHGLIIPPQEKCGERIKSK